MSGHTTAKVEANTTSATAAEASAIDIGLGLFEEAARTMHEDNQDAATLKLLLQEKTAELEQRNLLLIRSKTALSTLDERCRKNAEDAASYRREADALQCELAAERASSTAARTQIQTLEKSKARP